MGGSRQPTPSESADTHYTISPKKKQSLREKKLACGRLSVYSVQYLEFMPFPTEKGLAFFCRA